MSLCPMSSWHRAVSLLKTVSLSLVATRSRTPIYTAGQPWSQLFDFLCRFHLPHILWRLIRVNDLYFVVWFSWQNCPHSSCRSAHISDSHVLQWVCPPLPKPCPGLYRRGLCSVPPPFPPLSQHMTEQLSQLFDVWINLSNSIANFLRTPVIWSGGEDTEHR